MPLPLTPPYLPMEALATAELPSEPGWQYEPKWDGFRCLVFRDGENVELQSKSGQPLARYFPDLVDAFRTLTPRKFVLDGEIVLPVEGKLSFADLQLRLHPAASRVNKLAREHPARFIAFDLLADERGRPLTDRPLAERRKRLEAFAERYFPNHRPVTLSPAVTEVDTARDWLRDLAGGLDGVIAKRLDAKYEPGERSGAMRKIKKIRTADCVVGGFRYASKGRQVGSLLLGLYDSGGKLNHIGFTSSFPSEQRGELTRKLERMIEAPGFTGSAPGGPSRWSNKRSSEWEPVRPELVVEVRYDHFTGGRFRHGTGFVRWRPDKDPRQCTLQQVEQEARIQPAA